MPFPVLGSNSAVAGFSIDNSLRFNQEDDARLSRTPSSAGNRQKFTLSTWVKFCNFNDGSGSQNIFESRPGDYFLIVLTNINNATGGNTIRIEATGGMNLGIDRFFRDGSAWYHLVFAFDTTQATASNRAKFYVNGVQTGLNSTYTTYPNLNQSFSWNNNVIQNVGGSAFSADENSDFYLADTYNIDGQQLAPTEFGETNDNGVWIPKNYTGSYGTNGFKLEFKQLGTAADATSIGADTSGNNNHFSQTNVTPALDRTEDTATNNFATGNPLARSRFSNQGTISEGNLKYNALANDRGWLFSSQGISQGKWYWEVKITATGRFMVGVGYESVLAFNGTFFGNNPSKAFSILDFNGNLYYDGTNTSYGSSLSVNDIVMVALDMDNHLCWFGKNGTWFDSATQSEIENSTATNDATTQMGTQQNLNSGEPVFPFMTCQENAQTGGGIFNFGNPPFSISSGNADANGYGNFEYAVPSGYYALCTKNLAEYG